MTYKERRQFLLLARVFVAGFILFYVLFQLIMAYLISSLSSEAFDQVKTKNVDLSLHLNTTVRKNLIIFSHGRSGSSIIGDIFNILYCVGVTNSEHQLKRKLSWSLNPVDKLQIEV